MTDLTHGQLIIARREDPAGYVLARYDETQGTPVGIVELSRDDMEQLHVLVHQLRDREAPDDGATDEAPEETEEDRLINNLWNLGRYAAEIEQIETGRRHLVAAIKQVELSPSRETIAAHPLIKLADARRRDLRALISELV